MLTEALVHIGASVGVALYPEHACTGPQLLICADRALYAVKRSGKSAYLIFDAHEHVSDESLSLLRSDLKARCARSSDCAWSISRSWTSRAAK